jgi:hypothetical protein
MAGGTRPLALCFAGRLLVNTPRVFCAMTSSCLGKPLHAANRRMRDEEKHALWSTPNFALVRRYRARGFSSSS